MTTEMSAVKQVPFNSIFIPDEENIRTDLPEVKDLAESINEKGLLQPLIVVNGGDKLRLLGGYRRAAALKHLKWGSKLVNVVVRDEWDPLVTAVENIQRVDVSPVDQARFFAGLFVGDYNGPFGKDQEPRKYSYKEIADGTGLTITSVQNYVRVHEKLSDDVRKLCKKYPNAPISLLLRCISHGKEEVQVDEATGEKTKVWIPDDAKQLRVLNEWIEKQAEQEKDGRKRAKRGSKKDDGSDGPEYKRKPQIVLEACVRLFNRKKDESSEYAAYAQALRFASGETDRLPGLKKEELEEEVKKIRAKNKEE